MAEQQPEVLGKPVPCRVTMQIEDAEGWAHRRILTGASMVTVAEYTDGFVIRVFTQEKADPLSPPDMGVPIGTKKYGS